MRKNFLLALQLFVVGMLVIWHSMLGIGNGYYWTVSWWDIVSHILGGLWVGLFVAWVAALYRKRISFVQVVLCALSVGVAWEIFEYVENIGGSIFMSYQLDTAKDLFDDVIGGAIAGYIARRRL